MKGRAVLVTAGVAIAVVALSRVTFAASICPDANACVQVSVGNATDAPGATVHIPIIFKQGPDNGQAGGIDEIAALALTLNLGNGGTLLTLADCNLNGDGLPGAVKPDGSVSNFKVVVENVTCSDTRTHCLCPDAGSGITPDNFINLVIYGPNPLPTPGPTGIDIPTLPSGPPPFVTIDLKIADGASGMIPLHVFNETDTEHPQFTALLSVGDKTAVDQTCVPVSGSPPCSSGDSVSQVAITDGTVDVQGCNPGCVGDCDKSGTVSVNELITMVNIALGAAPVSTCTAGDLDCNGTIEINEIITAVNNALNGCPAAP